MGGKQSDSSRQMEGFMRGASSYQEGANPYDTYSNWDSNSNYMMGIREGWSQMAGQSSSGTHEASSYHTASSYSYEDQQADYEAQVEAARVAQGISDRDSLYSSYLDAASSAAEYVNSEITQEASNAKLLGIDYVIDQDQKTSRINDYFATTWGEGDQTQLEALMGEFGNPTGFTEFTVTRGTGGTYDTQEGSEQTEGTGQGVTPKKTLATTEDEEVLGNTNVLGV